MNTSARRILLQALLVLSVVAAPFATAHAASLQVAPTSVTLAPAENAGALWLSNADE